MSSKFGSELKKIGKLYVDRCYEVIDISNTYDDDVVSICTMEELTGLINYLREIRNDALSHGVE